MIKMYNDLDLQSVEFHLWNGWRPDKNLSIIEHCSENLYLVSGKNPFPGLINLELTPYLREILDALMPGNGVEKVVLMKGWQTGGTLAALAWMLWVMDVSPAPMLIVQPNDELRSRFSKQRIDPIVANCKSLQGKIKDLEFYESSKNKEKSTQTTKVFPGGFLNLGTSRAASSLRSDSVKYIVFDEVSAYDDDCQGEGDPCGIALGRTSNYEGRKKLFYISTPKIKGSCRIEQEYDLSDKRRLHFPCLNCGEYQVIEWPRIDFSGSSPVYKCIKCEHKHHEQDKTQILKLSKWTPTSTAKEPGTVGFHLPALYAPLGMYSWEDALKQFKKGKTNPQELKVFINNVLGETWEDRSIKSIDPEDLSSLAEDYSFGPDDLLPEKIGLITAGVDTHPSHVDIVIRGWGRGQESWILDHVIVDGDSNSEHVWDQVLKILRQTYTHHTSMKLRVAASCVDTGGHNTEAVYDFCQGRLGEYILAIKGAKDPAAPVIGNHRLVRERSCHLFPVGKLATHGRLFSSINSSISKADAIKKAAKKGDIISYEGKQLLHFHHGLTEGFYKQLTSPRPRWVRKDGQVVQVYETVDGVADHVHDCMRYADAAFCFLNIDIDDHCDRLDRGED